MQATTGVSCFNTDYSILQIETSTAVQASTSLRDQRQNSPRRKNADNLSHPELCEFWPECLSADFRVCVGGHLRGDLLVLPTRPISFPNPFQAKPGACEDPTDPGVEFAGVGALESAAAQSVWGGFWHASCFHFIAFNPRIAIKHRHSACAPLIT